MISMLLKICLLMLLHRMFLLLLVPLHRVYSCYDPVLLLPSPRKNSLVLGSRGIIGSGVSSRLLAAPRCLLKTPSSPAKARRKSVELATPKEQGTSATFNTRSLGFI